MAQAERDPNQITSALGWNGSNTQPFKVDPTTNRLLIAITNINGGGTLRSTPAKRDPNHLPNATALDQNGDTANLLVTNDGELIVELTQE